MKGITPIIAIILLLMITIAMVGFAFVWFTEIAEAAQNATSVSMEMQLRQSGTKVRIEAINYNTIILRNTGNYDLIQSETKVYVNGTIEVTGCPTSLKIPPGGSDTCISPLIGGCASIRVSTIGLPDSINC